MGDMEWDGMQVRVAQLCEYDYTAVLTYVIIL
jgi:hypothetical protein